MTEIQAARNVQVKFFAYPPAAPDSKERAKLYPVRTVLVDGTLRFVTKDIDEILTRPGHGHVLVGIPAEEKQKIRIHRDAMRPGERHSYRMTVSGAAIIERMQKTRLAEKKILAKSLTRWVTKILNDPTAGNPHHVRIYSVPSWGHTVGWAWTCTCTAIDMRGDDVYSSWENAVQAAELHRFNPCPGTPYCTEKPSAHKH